MSELNIYQRINAVMKKIQYVQKDKAVNAPGQNYKAVTHDNVTAQIRQYLVEFGIVVHVEQLKGEFLIKRDLEKEIKMHLYSGDYAISFVNIDNGEDRLTVTMNAQAADNGDKAPGKCCSYATKYAMLKTFSIETGEDEESRTAEPILYTGHQKALFDELIEGKKALDFVVFAQSVGPEVMMALNGSFEKGKISMGKKLCKELEQEGWAIIKDYANQIKEMIANQDSGVGQLVDELEGAEKKLVANLLTQEEIEYLRNFK